jgi:hypothetical protein
MIKGTPSPWTSLPVEKMKEMKDRYKLINDIEKEAQREETLKKEKLNEQGQTQMEAMQDTLPFLDRG